MDLLNNKTAIITGASSGIGFATAKLFATHGANVIVAARRIAELNNLVATIKAAGGSAIAAPGDVTEEAFSASLVKIAIDNFGKLDIAVNNAGTLGNLCGVSEMSVADWHHTLNTNLTSAFLGAKHQIPALLTTGAGSLIFTSSFVGNTVGMPGMSAYASAKAGLVGLTKTLAAEYGPQGLRVNALLPGGTDTPMGRSVATSPDIVAFVENLHALKRQASSEEIAQSALYLASDMSSFTTGTALYADGGVSISRT